MFRKPASVILQSVCFSWSILSAAMDNGADMVDEGYLDVTAEVDGLIVKRFGKDALSRQHPPEKVDWSQEQHGVVINSGSTTDCLETSDPNTSVEGGASSKDTIQAWADFRLAIGAELSQQIRARVHQELGYTCSTGKTPNHTCP